MKKLIVALAAAAVLGGCIKMDKAPPADMPAYVKIYPGGQNMMSMGLGSLSSDVFTTASSPDDVLAFYRTQAASDGLTEGTAPAQANAPADQKQAMFADAATGRMLVVVARPQQNQTIVSLTYKPTPKASS